MSTPFSFDPARSALLSMDCQTSIVSIYAKDQEPFLAPAASVLRHPRSLGMAVIHVKVGFRRGCSVLGTHTSVSPITSHESLYHFTP
jgi:nicotinamidase-related amidase